MGGRNRKREREEKVRVRKIGKVEEEEGERVTKGERQY